MFRWPITVYYEDTDAGGVVYHSNYLKFFERARSEWLRAMGICQSELLKQDLAFVVRKAELDFCHAARFEQQLCVESWISELKRASLVFEQQLVDENGICYCKASIKIASVSLSKMKPQAIPEPILQEFKIGER
ncbi:tol-pal system-associated acyl-CoA thioesterase [Shewanella yunxiaonensis]|uniref:Tol-pal system-associated acyl-CoA thioesterase n=1 Tax=Shewanella yunxiaonensis TaxID=2829809 RepID=A0ABX7YXB8_9GAMM|nr:MULTISPECIES: tol-pal system-associated acyl-CoA thioesterase [Shewanella]MDF0535443.1 tol-pal system-associated acyl-CoA thioesterase [Shewanella sp. A32]QUN07347.1 tol-pal system-associated acyl-CoA thioesterase [Shewanella yunxiaonensis]